MALKIQDFVDVFQALGLAPGDAVLLHSGLRAFGDYEESKVATVRKALDAVLGAQGTLAMPAFNFDFCNGLPYHHQNTPSTTGALTEAFRGEEGAIRSFHPVHSVCVKGDLARETVNVACKSSFGVNSVFDNMHNMGYRIVMAGSLWSSCTFFHYVEEQCKVPYRFWKTFKGRLFDQGREWEDGYPMYVRSDLNRPNDFGPMVKKLADLKLARSLPLGNSEISLVNSRDLVRETSLILKRDPEFLSPATKS